MTWSPIPSLVLDELKTEKSKRTISPLPAPVVAALRAHRLRQTDGIQRLPVATGYVFASSNGGPMDSQALLYHFKRLLAKAGLPDFRFHDLRHSCATILLAAGVPPKVIQEMLGHSQISTTMNIYAHVMPTSARRRPTRWTRPSARPAPSRFVSLPKAPAPWPGPFFYLQELSLPVGV